MEIITGKTYYSSVPIYKMRDLLIRGVARFPDRVAVAYRNHPGDHEIIEKTYTQLYTDVARMQRALESTFPRGSKIAVIGENSYAWMVTYLAVASGFGVIVPIDRLLKHEEIKPLIERSGADAVMYDHGFHALFSEDDPRLSSLTRRFVMNRDKLKPEIRATLEDEMRRDDSLEYLEDFLACAALEDDLATRSPDEVLLDVDDPADTCAILFTSGTSAESKAVMLTNKSLMANVRALLGSVKFCDPLHSLSVLPLHHTFENTCGFLAMLSIGGRIDICDGLRYIAKNLKEHRSEIIIAVPTLLEAMHRQILRQAKRRGSEKKLALGLKVARLLRKIGIDRRRAIFKDILDELGGRLYIIISGAASLDKETLRFFDTIGISVLQGYGLTEASPVVAGGNTKVNVLGTVGQPLAGITVAIDNDKPGEEGEILVYADTVMKGYYRNPEATAEAIDENGWLHTGDIGRIGRKNTITITGRSKSMIVLQSGKKVFPEELETLLQSRDFIKDSLVFGQETAKGDVVITAKVVVDEDKIRQQADLAPNGSLDDVVQRELSELIEEINRNVPSFKGIRSYFYSFQDMIKTTTMKVRRGVETERLQHLFREKKANWQALRGENIDRLVEQSDTATAAEETTPPPVTRETVDQPKSREEESEHQRYLKRSIRKLRRDLRVVDRQRRRLRREQQKVDEKYQRLNHREFILEQRLTSAEKKLRGDV